MDAFRKYQENWVARLYDEKTPIADGYIVMSAAGNTGQTGIGYEQLDHKLHKLTVAVMHAPATFPYSTNVLPDACDAGRVERPLQTPSQLHKEVLDLCCFGLREVKPAFLVRYLIDEREKTYTAIVQHGLFKPSKVYASERMNQELLARDNKVTGLLELMVNKALADKEHMLQANNNCESRFSFRDIHQNNVYSAFSSHVSDQNNHAFATQAVQENLPYIYRLSWDQKGKQSGSSESYQITPAYHRAGFECYANAVAPFQRIVDLTNQYNTAALLTGEQPPVSGPNTLYIANMANSYANNKKQEKKQQKNKWSHRW